MLLVILVNALFSLIFPLGKIALQWCQPFFLIGLRMLMGGLLLTGYAFFFRERVVITKKFLGKVVLLAIFNIYFANAFEFWGLQYMSSAKTCFIYNLSPFFSALFGYLHFDERMTLKKWFGLLVSFLGFLPIFIGQSPDEITLSHLGFFSTAELSLVIATIATVYGWIVMQDVVRARHGDPVLANGLSMLLGGLLSIANSMLVETWDPIPLIQWWPFLFLLLAIVVISNVICYSLYTYILKSYTATLLAFSSLVGPFFAALYDWIFFETLVSWHFYFATILVFIGLYFFYQEEIRQGHMNS